MKKKIIAIALCAALAVGGVVAGSLAWLQAETPDVVNTFTYGDINIELTETDPENDSNALNNSYKMIPGYSIAKDPTVTVKTGSEDCLLFVKVEKSDYYDTYLEETMGDGWIQLTKTVEGLEVDVEGVYYRTVLATDATKTFSVLKDNKVTVKDTVTKADMEAIDGIVADGSAEGAAQAELDKRPTLTFKAYAHQLHKSEVAGNDFTAEEAWKNLTTPATP